MPLCKDNSDPSVQENKLADGTGHKNMGQINLLNNKSSQGGYYVHISDGQELMLNNLTLTSNITVSDEDDEKNWLTLNELQMIKVIVLVIVVGILLISTCKIVFKTFSRYSGKRPDHL